MKLVSVMSQQIEQSSHGLVCDLTCLKCAGNVRLPSGTQEQASCERGCTSASNVMHVVLVQTQSL